MASAPTVPQSRVVRRRLAWLRRGPGALLVCPECDLTGGPFEVDEARYLAELHDRFQHRGLVTAS